MTESILFGIHIKLQSTSSQLNFTCGEMILADKYIVRYLETELDQHWSGNYIARKAISNINNKVNFLFRNTHVFNVKVNKLLTSALNQCHFDCASACRFSGLSKKQVKCQVLQNESFVISSQPYSQNICKEISFFEHVATPSRIVHLE